MSDDKREEYEELKRRAKAITGKKDDLKNLTDEELAELLAENKSVMSSILKLFGRGK